MALRQDGGAVMSSNDDKKQSSTGKTDFSKFRLSTNSPGMPVAQKVLIHVPVGKPGKQKFVRVHPAEKYHFGCALLKVEDDDRPYLISPDIAHTVAQDIKQVILKLAIDRQGNIFLWPVPPRQEDGNENIWNQSHREIAELAETFWVRLASNRAIGSYEPFKAQGEIPEPTWPDHSFEEILEIAFGSSHVIKDREHPALLKLWGIE
jgi:hypothetical protein